MLFLSVNCYYYIAPTCLVSVYRIQHMYKQDIVQASGSVPAWPVSQYGLPLPTIGDARKY